MPKLNTQTAGRIAALTAENQRLAQQLSVFQAHSQQSTQALSERLHHLQAEAAHHQKESTLYQAKYAQSVQAYNVLLAAFKQSQRRTFGANSERFLDPNVSQPDFFSDVPAQSLNPDSEERSEPSSSLSTGKDRKKRRPKSNDFAKNLPRREVVIPAEDQQEGDRFMRYERTELLNYIPPVYEIIVQKREVWVRASATITKIITAPNPLRVLPKAKVTESFLAHTIVSKLYDRQPLYHLEKQFRERFDFMCPRNKLARWFIQSAQALQPLVNLMRDELLNYDVTGCDPTHLQVLREPGRKAQQKSYVYSIRGGPPERAIRLFTYQAQDHTLFLQHWFADYRGYLQVDGQNIFTSFEQNEQVELVFCHAHARRKFEPIAKAATRPGLAHQAMAYYRALYKIERQAKRDQLAAPERQALRQAKSRPIIDEMFAWMQEVSPTTLPKSPLGLAFRYVLIREAGLRRFLEDGRLEIDTNLVEQQNKDLALARNNFLFSCSVEGAHALCVHLSLVFTAVAQGLDPYHYYVDMMKQVPHCQTVEDYEALLPWCWREQRQDDQMQALCVNV